MGIDVAAPLDVAVGRVGDVAKLQHQQDILSGQDVDGRFQQRTDIPGDPLFPESEEDEESVGDADRRGAGVPAPP